jgi:hypothetical protein
MNRRTGPQVFPSPPLAALAGEGRALLGLCLCSAASRFVSSQNGSCDHDHFTARPARARVARREKGEAMPNICRPHDRPDLKQIVDRTMALFAVYTGATLSFFVKDFLFSDAPI